MKDGDRLNCPNCGAPIVNGKCDYCGAIFLDFANINVGDLTYLNVRINDKILFLKTVTNSVTLNMSSESCPVLEANFTIYEACDGEGLMDEYS